MVTFPDVGHDGTIPDTVFTKTLYVWPGLRSLEKTALLGAFADMSISPVFSEAKLMRYKSYSLKDKIKKGLENKKVIRINS